MKEGQIWGVSRFKERHHFSDRRFFLKHLPQAGVSRLGESLWSLLPAGHLISE
jgi:hypothetical protein